MRRRCARRDRASQGRGRVIPLSDDVGIAPTLKMLGLALRPATGPVCTETMPDARHGGDMRLGSRIDTTRFMENG